MKILIPGISGAIGRRLALRLHAQGHQVAGIDLRKWPDVPNGIRVHAVDLRKRSAEDVFRKFRPEVVIHLATVTSFVVGGGDERYRINLGGTRAVFEHCHRYGVEHAIFIGRHTFYGAGPDSPLYHTEDEPPQGLAHYPELADLVSADLFAATALWRFPEFTTTVLRNCYSLGASGTGTLAMFLRGKIVPLLLGFDPLFQLMHEEDVVSAIVLTIEKRIRGIFNVAGPPPLPLSLVAKGVGRRVLPLPEFILKRMLGRGGLPKLPAGALTHIKYPIVIDSGAFRKATGFQYEFDESTTLQTFAQAFPVEG